MRTDDQDLAIKFIEKWRDSEHGPFQTQWPFDVLTWYISGLEAEVSYLEKRLGEEMAKNGQDIVGTRFAR